MFADSEHGAECVAKLIAYISGKREGEIQSPCFLHVLLYLQEQCRVGRLELRAAIVVAIIAHIGAHQAVAEAVDVAFDARKMRLHHAIFGGDSAIGVVHRGGQEGVAQGAVEIVPTIAVYAIAVVAVSAAVDKAVFVVVGTRLVGSLQKLVGEAADVSLMGLRNVDTPQAIRQIHTETDEVDRSVFKDVLPIGTHFPALAFHV